MMGKAIANLDAYIAKGMGSLLFMNEKESVRGEVRPCLRCGKCVSACPMGLQPYISSLSVSSMLPRTNSLICPLITSSLSCTIFSDMVCFLLSEWCVVTSF